MTGANNEIIIALLRKDNCDLQDTIAKLRMILEG
jgi:hypothetical protein